MSVRDTVKALLDRHLLRFTAGVLVALFVFLLFADRIVVSIPAGYRGVLWHRIGGRTQVLNEGLHFIWPWNVLTRYEVRFQNIDRRYLAIDIEGLSLDLQVSTRLWLNETCTFLGFPPLGPQKVPCLGLLHQLFGPDYLERLVIPQLGSHIRSVIATKNAADVYGWQRPVVEDEIMKRIEEQIEDTHVDLIRVSGIFLREIVLPPLVVKAIEAKVTERNMVEEWEFRILREIKEAERKKQEAIGIKQFQDTVNASISDQYLRWRGIDATLKLAESANTKVVIIGSGPQGLPIILGNEPVSPSARPGPPRRTEAPAETQSARAARDATTLAEPLAPRGSPPKEPIAGGTTAPTGTDTLSASPAQRPAAEAKAPDPTAAPKAPRPTGFRAFLNRIMGLDQ